MKRRVGVFVCECGTNIASVVDTEKVAAAAKNMPGVIFATNYKYMCSDPGQDLIKNAIQEHGLQQVVVASCSPRMHEVTFRKTVQAGGINGYMFEMVNIREQNSWVHHDREQATRKAKDLVRMAVYKVLRNVPLEISTVPITKKAMVIGGGIAGMQAALSLDKYGFKVSLYEKEKQVGGLLNLASLPPHKEQLARLRDYFQRQLEKSGVNVLLEHPYDLKTLADEYPDYLVIAAGSRPLRPEIKGWDESFCLPFEHVLTGNIPIEESHVLVVGGGSNGCEMADFLLVGRNRISIVERMPYLAPDMEKKSRRDLINRLEKAQANIYTSAEIIEINSGKVIIRNKQGEMKEIEVDYVIAAVGYASNNPLYEAAQKVHHAVYLIGDSMQVGSIREAIAQGEMLARALTEFNY